MSLLNILIIVIINNSILFIIYLIFFRKRNNDIEEEEPETEALADEIKGIDRISVRTGSKIDIIETKDIIIFESNGDYVSLYTDSKVFLKKSTMKYYEENLSSELFVRTHRSFIVNIEHIESIETYKKNQYRIYLSNGFVAKASKPGYLLLKEAINL